MINPRKNIVDPVIKIVSTEHVKTCVLDEQRLLTNTIIRSIVYLGDQN